MLPECPVCSGQRYQEVCEVTDRFLKRSYPVYQIMECLGCGLGRTEPFPSLDEIPLLYPENYSGDVRSVVNAYLDGRLEGTSSWRMETEKVQLLETFKRGGKLLDVGCAEGKFLWALDKRRWDRNGIELNRKTLELVKNKISDLNYIYGDLNSAELKDGSFDVITFWHVLEHVPDPVSVASRVLELLKPGGIVIVSLPNLDSLQVKFFKKYWYAFDDVPRHLYHFTPISLQRLLEKTGFDFVAQRFFSRIVNFHCWKHSALNWSQDYFDHRFSYYAIKPFLLVMPILESITRKPGIFTQVARKPF